MTDYLNKTKTWFQNFPHREPSYGRKFLRPHKDWMIIFFSSLACVFLGALGAFYFYKQVDSGKYFTVDEEIAENEIKINISLLTHTVNDLNVRVENLKEAERGGIAPNDPAK